MAKTRSSRSSRSSLPERSDYWSISRRPLHILAFLLPLIIAYELALIFLLQSPQNVRTVLAHSYLLRFFDAFGVAPQGGLHLGAVAIVVVLLLWHVLNRDRWQVDFSVCGVMVLEALALTVPLLVLSQVISERAVTAFAPTPATELPAGLASKIAISIGAGLYEELMFRMLLIAVIHTLLVDVGKASHNVGAIVAVIVSAAAFTWYHPLNHSFARLAFFFLAGLYFGGVYVLRGFGIVVGVHALYDILTVSLLAAAPAP